MQPPANSQIQKEARDFAWGHFALHATHRLEMFKSYVAFTALTYAGFGISLQAKVYFIGAALSVFAISLSLVFYLFDRRIRQLLKISERYLLDAESELSKTLLNKNIRLFRKSDLITHIGESSFRLTYTNLFGGVYLINVVFSLTIFGVMMALLI
jgi:hypothetical protein